MKTTISQLRKLIKEMIEYVIIEGDSHRVTFTAKDGKKETRVFPNKKIADMYAKSVKNATVEPVDTEVADVEIKKVAPASLDDLRQAAKTFHDQTITGQKFDPRAATTRPASPPVKNVESGEDEYADVYRDAVMSGMSSDDAWQEVDYAKSRRTRRV